MSMEFDNPRLQAGISNLERGRHEAAFEVFFDIAVRLGFLPFMKAFSHEYGIW